MPQFIRKWIETLSLSQRVELSVWLFNTPTALRDITHMIGDCTKKPPTSQAA